MKWKILALLGLFTVSLTVVAQVLLTNLDQKSFVIDVTGPPTNVANLNLRRSQFSPSTTGWFITNVTGVTGISTNISTNDLWTIDGFGDLHPAVTNNQVTVTNLVVASNLVATGEFTLQKKSQLLVLGTNVLGSGVSSMFYLVSPTNDASQVIISLDDGASPGQLLLLVNYTNAVPANGAFTLPANSLVSGGGHVIQPEDWIATNTFAALYTWQSPDWLMIDAFAANGQSVFQTNYFQNIVVYSNITLRGNSTLTINNITISTNDLWHTNLVGGVATLQPINLGLQPMIVKGLTVGTNTTSSALLPAALANNVLSSVGNTDAGDPVERYIYIAQATSNGNPRSWLKSVVLTNSNSFQLGGNDGTSQVTFDILELGGNDFQFFVQTNSTTVLSLHPTATDGNTAYILGTDRTHTSGNLLEIPNNETNRFTFGLTGTGIIPEFEMHPMANALSSIRSTNGINFNIDGSSAYQWTLNGNSLLPGFNGSEIGSTTHPINGLHANVLVWGDGGGAPQGVNDSYGNGAPNGVFPASVGSVYRDTNGTPGAVLYVKETGVGNTGWTAIGGGGSGGTNSLWFSYTSNGTTASLYDTNSFSGSTIVSGNGVFGASGAFQSGLLTNSTDFIGIGQTAGRDLTASGSSSVTAIGESALRLGTLTGDFYIMAIGNGALDNAVVTNSLDVTAIGNSALHNATVYTSHDIIAEGLDALYGSTIKNSAQITAIANNSLYGAVLTNAVSIMGLNGALNAVNLTNAYNISGLGLHAGFNVTGNQTNMVYLGESAFAPSGSINQVVIGPGMSLVMGTNTISTNGATPSLPTWNGSAWPSGGGGSVFTNLSGIITPSTGQTTNEFLFTSGAADSGSQIGLSLQTSSVWTNKNGKLITLGNQQDYMNMYSDGTTEFFTAAWDPTLSRNSDAYNFYAGLAATNLSFFPAAMFVQMQDARGGSSQVSANGWVASLYAFNSFSHTNSSSPLNLTGGGGGGIPPSDFGIVANVAGSGQSSNLVSVMGINNSSVPDNNWGLVGVGYTSLSYGVGVSGSGLLNGNVGAIGGYFQTITPTSLGAPTLSSATVVVDNRDSGLPLTQWRTNNGTVVASVAASGIIASVAGLSSTATDVAVAITATGITNSLGKLAFAYLQGTNLTFTIKDSSNTPYFTNSVAIGIQALPVQAGGAITISSGTASGVLKAL